MENYGGKQIASVRVGPQSRAPYMGISGINLPLPIPLPPPLRAASDGAACYAVIPGVVLVVTPQPFDPNNLGVSVTWEGVFGEQIQGTTGYVAIDLTTFAPANSQILVATFGSDMSVSPATPFALADLPFSMQAYKINLEPPRE